MRAQKQGRYGVFYLSKLDYQVVRVNELIQITSSNERGPFSVRLQYRERVIFFT